jgi:Family of unknown function (DUF6765)
MRITMKIDFHYLAVKTLAVHAGFSDRDAQLISYASQYVDDAVEHKKIHIKNLPQELIDELNYDRISSKYLDPTCTAHKGLQIFKGLNRKTQRKVYISFHFIPKEKYDKVGNSPHFDYRVSPNSTFAKELVNRAISSLKDPSFNSDRSLIKLGIAIHSFADTWAHHRFSGRQSSRDNDIEDIELNKDGEFNNIPLWSSAFYNVLPAIGHAEAGNFPDIAETLWRYEHDASDKEITRDNPSDFLQAAKEIYSIFCEINSFESQWDSFEEDYKKCFYSSIKPRRKKQLFAETFPNISYAYHVEEWRKDSLDGTDHDWEGLDLYQYNDTHFKYNGDKKWFYFHREAYAQREYVIANIKKDLK